MESTFEVRFWARVNKNGPIPAHCPELGPCWIWTGHGERYGDVKKAGKKYLAHRFMFEMIKGPIPKGQYVCHHCDNGKCVNPNHLFSGTSQDNAMDSVKKGRAAGAKNFPHLFGKAHPNTKLTEPQVREILEMDFSRRGSKATAGRRFGIAPQHINNILRGKCWNHLV